MYFSDDIKIITKKLIWGYKELSEICTFSDLIRTLEVLMALWIESI